MATLWDWICSYWWAVILVILFVWCLVCCLCNPLRRTTTWLLWGHKLGYGVKYEANGAFQSLVALLAIILGGTVTLGLSIQQIGLVSEWYVALYIVAGLIPWAGMLYFVNRSKQTFCVTARLVWEGKLSGIDHAFDETVVGFARYLALVSFFFIFLIVGLVCTDTFPGQSRSNLVLELSGEPKWSELAPTEKQLPWFSRGLGGRRNSSRVGSHQIG